MFGGEREGAQRNYRRGCFGRGVYVARAGRRADINTCNLDRCANAGRHSDAWITYEWFAEGDGRRRASSLPDPMDRTPTSSPRTCLVISVVPAWSPDGNQIAFVKKVDTAARRFDLDDGRGRDGCEAVVRPQLRTAPAAPFGQPIRPTAAASHSSATSSTRRRSRSSTCRPWRSPLSTPVVLYPEHLDNPPSWSPDGQTIVFDVAALGSVRRDPWMARGSELCRRPEASDVAHRVRQLRRVGRLASDGRPHRLQHVRPGQHARGRPAIEHLHDAFGRFAAQAAHRLDEPSCQASRPGAVAARRLRFDGSCSYGNPVHGVQICLVDPSTGEITYQDHILSGARPDMRPANH